MTDLPLPLPAEWASQRCLWVGWPRLPEEWQGLIEPARREIAVFVRAAAEFVPVRLAIGSDDADKAARALSLESVARLDRVPTGDIWLRDTGPIFTLSKNNGLFAHNFRFNGWGDKYAMPGDEATAEAIATLETGMMESHSIVLEGGAIDSDGQGLLLTTRECLLNPNRNGTTTAASVERWMQSILGARKVIWIDEGLLNDHTDGHIDNAARFVAPGHAVCQAPAGLDDPHRDRLLAIEDTLRSNNLTVTTIPSPGEVQDQNGEIIPASHMNFLITNGAVIVPTYEKEHCVAACATLAELFPQRRVIPLSARAILAGGGGGFHCMTKDVPQARA
ncbi:agmatine deiminase family protein [Parvularcula sp. LCG005]|uniref:agmatine deiminase family protein n=1 Tax=Parvularcula sp. LCG005 TaxID=3078805 RepID=UPI0029438127|nr:agmatine deiminase family protein [Parvularcula sp. LCG005]WOI54424.1 agmatine deiminase family protein [Parvularcula sp. LCG005]